MKVQLAIRIDEEDKKRLEEKAEKKGMTASQYARYVIKKDLDEDK